MEIVIYSMTRCDKCKTLRQFLDKKNFRYKEIDMETPAALTELEMNGVITLSAPVLQVGDKFYTTKDLFLDDRLDNKTLENILIT